MSIVCGKCHREFKGIYALFMFRKAKGKIFHCKTCYTPFDGDTSKVGILFPVLLILSLFTLGFACIILVDAIKRAEWEDLEKTPIDEVEEGKLSRIEGILNTTSGFVVLGGEEVPSGRAGYRWEWDDSARFKLTDRTGTLTVVTDEYYDIANGLHATPEARRTHTKIYHDQDRVIIIGTLDDGIFHLLWVGPNEEEMGPDFSGVIWWSGLGSIMVFLLILDEGIKRRKHRKSTGKQEVFDLKKYWMNQDPNIQWKKNFHFGLFALNSILLVFIPVTLFVFFLLGLPEAHTQRTRGGGMSAGLIVGICLASIALLRIAGPPEETKILARGSPTLTPFMVGISEQGIYMFSPHPAFTYHGLIPWEHIIHGRTDTILDMLSSRNREIASTEMRKQQEAKSEE